MSLFEIFLMALALSIDACVVSFSYGLAFQKNRLKNSFLLSFSTGFFQFLMPFFGYYLTNFVKNYIESYAQYLVFSIFVLLGIKFIKEAFDIDKKENLCISFKCLLLLGIATSIDAFCAGINLSLTKNSIFLPSLIIGMVTFLNASFGFFIGGKLKSLPTKNLEIIAGIILICLGIKALI